MFISKLVREELHANERIDEYQQEHKQTQIRDLRKTRHHRLQQLLQRRPTIHDLKYPHQSKRPQHCNSLCIEIKELQERHHDNNCVKDVKIVLDVFEKTEAYELEDHFSGKQDREDRVRDFEDGDEVVGHVVVLDCEGDSVEEDEDDDDYLEQLAINNREHLFLHHLVALA